MALMRVVKGRTSPKVELLVDGHSGFLFLDKSGMPKVAMHLENYMRGLQARFEKAYGKPVPRITPMCCVTPSAPTSNRRGLM